jgi:hypothetical protein
MYEEYPDKENYRTINSLGETYEVDESEMRVELRSMNNPARLDVTDEGPFNTVAYYNAIGRLIHQIEFTGLADLQATATYTPPKPEEGEIPAQPEQTNVYERGKAVYDLVYSDHQINRMPEGYTLSEALEERLGSVNEAVAALFQSIRNYMEGGEEQAPPVNQFRKLAQEITVRDIDSLRGKREIYEWWQNKYDLFTNTEQLDLGVKLSPNEAATFKSVFSKVKMPCPVIAHTDAELEQPSGNFGLLQMANEILMGRLGMAPSEEYTKVFGVQSKVSGETEYDDEGNPVGSTGVLTTEVSDFLEDITMIKNSIDPLTYLNLLEKKILFLPDEGETREDLLKKIRTYLPKELGDLNESAISFLAEMVGEAIDEYTSLVDRKDRYYLPMLDNHTAEMSSVPIVRGFTVNYFDIDLEEVVKHEGRDYGDLADTHTITLTLKNETIPATYSQLMDYLNERIIELFTAINSVMIEGRKTKFVANTAQRESSNKRDPTPGSSTQTATIGARYPSRAGSMATVKGNQYDDFLEFVYARYIVDMDARYLFNRDYPSYFSNGMAISFKSAFDASKKKKGSVIAQQVSRFPSTAIGEEQLKYLDEFLATLRRGATSNITSLINSGENAIEIYLMINLTPGQSRAEKSRLNKSITNSIGRIIHDYAAMRGEERLTKYVFSGKQIAEYADEEIDSESMNILAELQNPDFLQTLNNDEKQMVKHISNKLTSNFLVDILGEEDSDIENSLMKAIDLLRKGNGLMVYKAHLDMANVDDVSTVSDLIKKENRVDLYAQDMETILNSHNKTFKELSKQIGVSEEVIYKVRGLFR